MSREELIAARARLTEAQRNVTRLAGAGNAEVLQNTFRDAAINVRELHGRLIASRSMDDLLRAEPADRPILLAPLRIETRFERADGSGDPNALIIRVFPDAFSTEFFDEKVTAEEVRLAKLFIDAETAEAGSEMAQKALEALIAVVEPERLLYVLEGVKSDSFASEDIYPDTDETVLSTMGQYRGLPDRYVAIGFRDGVELFRKEGEVVDAALPTVLDPETVDAIPVWFHDVDEAIARGMAIRLDGADFAPIARGERPFEIDRLIVVGAEIASAPNTDTSATTAPESSLAALIRGHRFGPSGLSFPEPGAPTNATETLAVDHDAEAPPPDRLRELARGEAEDLTPGADATNFANALGLVPAVLAGAPGASRSTIVNTWSLFEALSPGSLGAYRKLLVSPQPDPNLSNEFELFARLYLYPGGVFPTFRIDDQPYGVLPVTPSVLAQDLIEDERDFDNTRRRSAYYVALLMESFAEEIGQALSALTSDRQQGEGRDQLNTVLRWLPRSHLFDRHLLAHEWHFRHALALAGFDDAWSERFQLREATGAWQRGLRFGGKLPPLPARLFPMAEASGIAALLVPEGDIDAALDALADLTFDEMLDRLSDEEQSLLERMVLSTAFWSMLEAKDWLLTDRIVIGELDVSRLELPLVQAEQSPLQFLASNVEALLLAEDLPAASPDQSVGAYLLSLDDSVLASKNNPWPAARAALRALKGTSRKELERLTSLFVDGLSYRLDAWRTGISIHALERLRTAKPDRVALIGAYGVIENLRPAPLLTRNGSGRLTMEGNRGFIHAHSLDHATTAAVLRAAFEPSGTDPVDETLAVDLSSDRVRKALNLVEGLAAGGTVSGLLGAQFEADLRAADVDGDLLQHLPTLRAAFPGLADAIDETAAEDDAEQAQGMQIVDGQKLANNLESRSATGLFYFLRLSAIPEGSVRERIDAAAARVVETLDAFDDLCVAEGVHQILKGQVDRSAAAIEMMSSAGAGSFPTPEIVHRSNPGAGVTLRLVLADNTPIPPTLLTPRARLAPTVNAWLGEHLQPVFDQELSFTVLIDGESQDATLRLSDLELAPIDIVTLGVERISPLMAQRASGQADTRFEAAQSPEWHIAMGAIRAVGDLLKGASPLADQDLRPSGQPSGETDDLASVRERLNQIVRQLEQFETRLNTAAADEVAAVLNQLLIFDPGLSPLDQHLDGEALRRNTATQLNTRRAKALEVLAQPDLGRGELEMIAKDLCGDETIITVPFAAPLGTELENSLVNRASLLAAASAEIADPVADWAEGLIEVRPKFAALAAVDAALGGTILSAGPHGLEAGQLPYSVGDPWLAHILPPDYSPEANSVSFCFVGGAPSDMGQAIEGLKLDEWVETIATNDAPQAMSLNFDAPDTEAPNCCLLAIPRPTADFWSVDELIGCVDEALLIAEWRGLTPDHFAGTELSQWLPATLAPLSAESSLFSVDFAAAPAEEEG